MTILVTHFGRQISHNVQETASELCWGGPGNKAYASTLIEPLYYCRNLFLFPL